jgi:hypothetical protein
VAAAACRRSASGWRPGQSAAEAALPYTESKDFVQLELFA